MNKLKIILYLFIMLLNSQTNTVEIEEPEVKRIETKKAIIYSQMQPDKNFIILCSLNKKLNHVSCNMKDIKRDIRGPIEEDWYNRLETIYERQQQKGQKEQKQ